MKLSAEKNEMTLGSSEEEMKQSREKENGFKKSQHEELCKNERPTTGPYRPSRVDCAICHTMPGVLHHSLGTWPPNEAISAIIASSSRTWVPKAKVNGGKCKNKGRIGTSEKRKNNVARSTDQKKPKY